MTSAVQSHIRIFPSAKASPSPYTEVDDERSSLNISIPSAAELERTVQSTLEPEWNTRFKLSTAVIAVMSCYRMALKAVIESCISQGAWIWVSGFRKGKVEAKLEDFKMFDEAATGLHLACVGAAIMILAQGFETFSSAMISFDEENAPLLNGSNANASLAPPPPRAETWHHGFSRSAASDLSLSLSTKAAIYEGIISSAIPTAPVSCSGTACIWPPFPTLGVCGNCTESAIKLSCDTKNDCNFTMPSGTSILKQSSASPDLDFIVAPSNGIMGIFNSDPKALFSIFDIMSISQNSSGIEAQAHECALWFCLQNLNISVGNGIQQSDMLTNWSKTELSTKFDANSGEFTFVDIPPELHVRNQTRYSVPEDSIHALKNFMNSLMSGSALETAGVVKYSSDWIEAVRNATPDLDDWVARLALSITNHIRQTGDSDEEQTLEYVGTPYVMASHVRVNWLWIIYPLTLMVLAFCYLAQTV
ncbi:uncharacterized protein F4822DRAFT_425895 [Hypoxylon trugodes]|uniref:uncharacterized protein n=1 Tax=Hypoxylon trugodes TaxID=326681 RepID=UPI00219E3911|nr:uncharacterized protein F4822DRAFT_425895 [Hypoxylon trugodes]KAI1392692.1 hypothetical protein F4822DRAFT_425895 [Hypoxylon trugodes]